MNEARRAPSGLRTAVQRSRWLQLLVASLLLGSAQPASADEDTQLWASARVNHAINEDWAAAVWTQGRIADDVSEADQFLIAPNVHYRILTGLKVGIAWTYWAKRNASDEVDLAQELSYSRKLADLVAGNRVRLEQRFRNDTSDVVHRGRHRLHLAHPIGETRAYAVLWNEVFVNFNDEKVVPHGYEQNRLFGGVGFRLGGFARVEVGYMWRNLARRGMNSRDDHTVSLSLFLDTRGATPPSPEPQESHH